MTFNWRNVKLGDIADVTKLAGFEFTKYIKYDNTGEIIALRALNIRNGTLDLSEIKKIKKEVSNSLLRSKLYANDILLTYTGNGYGDCAIITENDKFHLAPNVCKLTPKLEFVNPYYLYTYIRSRFFYNQMNNYIGGSGQPTIPMKTIRILKIPIVDLETQQKIAKVLSAIDDKIELNNSINNNLEQQAQAIFKSWFIDFEPFNGIIPDDWSEDILGNFIEIKRGGSPRPIQDYIADSGYRWLKISDATSIQSPFILNIKEHIKERGINKTVLLKSGSLVLSNSATPGIPKILDVDSCIHDGWLYFPKSMLSNEYLYLLFKFIRPNLVALGNGSVFTNLKTDILRNYNTILPDKETLTKFDGVVSVIFKQILYNTRENEKLIQLRDTLLPKLMSGEIDVSKVEIDDILENQSADKLLFSEDKLC